MRDPKRIPEVLEALKRAWERNPDLRLGQLILNLSSRENADRTWVMEDAEWVRACEKY